MIGVPVQVWVIVKLVDGCHLFAIAYCLWEAQQACLESKSMSIHFKS